MKEQALVNIDEAFNALNSLLDAAGALQSETIQRAVYQLRLEIVRGLGDQDRISAAEVSLNELIQEGRSANMDEGLSRKTVEITLESIVLRMKHDVLALIRSGQIPLSVSTFGQLHDYCDANCLGGLCEDSVFDSLIEQHGGRDKDDGMPDGMHKLINGAQDEIHNWVKRGGHGILANLPARAKEKIQDTLSNNEIDSDQDIVEFWVNECKINREAAELAILFRREHLTHPLYEFFSYDEIQ